jgi:hypothetical protein
MKESLDKLKTLDSEAYSKIEEFYLIRNVADGIDLFQTNGVIILLYIFQMNI